MWIVCITSVRHVLTVNGYGGRQTKENEKSWCFKGWETLDSNYSVELDFMEGIGVVEIAISQNGSVIYSSSENILSPLRKYLQLPFGVSGEYCIEIKGDNGAYAYGCFEL